MKILIGTPTYDGTIHTTYFFTMLETISSMVEAGIENVTHFTYGSLLELSRNKLASRVVNDRTFSHLLFIDADMGFTEDSFHKLIENSDLPIVALACPLKQEGKKNNVHGLGAEVRPGVHECETVGTGVMLIRREVLDKMVESGKFPVYSDDGMCYAIFRNEVVDARYRGEDINFCHKWRDMGGKIHVVTDCEVTHRGQNVWTYKSDLVQAKGVGQ
jgi:hypothetical protein